MKKKKEKPKSTKVVTIVDIVIAMLLVLTILGLIIFKGKPTTISNYSQNQYKILYQEDNNNTFKIYKTKENRVWVESNLQPICVTDPCPRVKNKVEIKFRQKHMETIIEFIESFFKNQTYKEKNLSKSEISEDKLDILYSIIYNDESYLNKMVYILKDDKYIITTDMKYKTMLNDGGSYTSIIYEIDLKLNEITKKEEQYHANLGGTPTTNTDILYSKKIDYYLYEDTIEVIGESLEKEDTDLENNLNYYTITSETDTKEIHNLNTISKIKKLLTRYDEYSTNERQLLFAISSIDIKCSTPTLIVYNDNTYEYYYTYTIGDNKIVPKTGTYDYDINLILDNVSKYETTDLAMYRLLDKNEKSHDLTSFEQLETFLKKLNLEINKCTELQQ